MRGMHGHEVVRSTQQDGAVTAFDADVLIYATIDDHPLGKRVRRLFTQADGRVIGVGSLLLLVEVLTKPLRDADSGAKAAERLEALLGRLDLKPVDDRVASLALSLAVRYGLRAADATHLATAIAAGADRFLTNSRKDFPKAIEEIEVVYPDELPELE